MPTKTDDRTEVAKKVLTDTLYAAAGVGELAVAELRKLPERARNVDRDAVRDQVLRTVGDYQVKATDAYEQLVKRGRGAIETIRDQKTTQELEQRLVETTQTAVTAVSALTGRKRIEKPAEVEGKADATATTPEAAAPETKAETPKTETGKAETAKTETVKAETAKTEAKDEAKADADTDAADAKDESKAKDKPAAAKKTTASKTPKAE